MGSVEHRTEQFRVWSAWAGTQEDLRRLGATVTQLCEGKDASCTVVASAKHGAVTSVGSLDDVMLEFDRRNITRLTIIGSFPEAKLDKIGLRLTWEGTNTGVRIEIETSDIGWANQCMAALSSEIDKGVPAWRIFHSWGARFALSLALVATVTWVIYLSADALFHFPPPNPDPESPSPRTSTILWSISALAVPAVYFCFTPIYDRFFPPVEIVGEGQGATAGRRIAFLATIPLTFALGLIVNWIS